MSTSAQRFIAGVGASAGGLESLEQFFRGVPLDSGVSYVVVQHLSADHKSLMDELLGRFTRLPISVARDGDVMAPDHIYLLSPGKELEIEGDHLRVFDRDPERALAFPIDRLLVSLAESCGPYAIGVILSGSGSDGTRGVRRIEDMGGLVLVEDPALAAFDGMPSAAIETGVAAAVMSAEALAGAIVDHASTGALPAGDDAAAVEDIVRLLQRKQGVDFGEYKRGTIFRRVSRRAKLADAADLQSYRALLDRDPAELTALHHDLLIGVTCFFRDPEWFAVLAREIDDMVVSPIEPGRELRAWVAGCASGEEAYSVAILMDEAIRKAGSARSFKVFATDVHPSALEAAGAGIYGTDPIEHVNAARRGAYFRDRGDGTFQIQPELRQHVVFARHDVLVDTPFTNLDLVTCRNLLIYFKAQAQRRALASLAYGLRVGGLLFLGSSETPGEMNLHFDVVDETGRLFRKRVHSRAMQRPAQPVRAPRRAPLGNGPPRPESRLLPLYDALLDRFMPPGFLLSEQRALLDSYAGAEKLLQVGKRRPMGDFLDLVPEAARLRVSGVLARAQREAGPTSFTVVAWTMPDGTSVPYRIEAERLTLANAEPAYLLTLVEQRPAIAPDAPNAADAQQGAGEAERMNDLEHELASTRMSLQSTVEELEASNEELQATNEELVASNEELQSVNEELHSVNEELHTVNAEHQLKIGELMELNRDISHLLESIDVATIYLDRELRIRKYTPRAAAIFGLVEHDVGRFLASFNHQLHYPALMDDVKAVRDGVGRIEKEVRSHEGRSFFARLLPYRIGAGIDGVVVTLTDASALAAAKAHALQLSSIVESTGDAVIGQSLDGTITSWNAAATRIYGYTADEMIGQSIMTLVPEEEREAMAGMLGQIAAGSDLINIAARRVSKSGAVLEIAKTMSPIRDAQGARIGIATIDRDVREQNEMERRLRESDRRYADLYNNAPDIYLAIDTRTSRIVEFNDTFLRICGFAREEAQSMHVLDLFPHEAQGAARQCLDTIRGGEPVNDAPLTILRKNAGNLAVTLSATPMFAPDGSVTGSRTVLRDVSERRLAEARLAQAAQMREQFLAMVSHELRSPLHAINAAFQIIDSPGIDPANQARSEAVVRRQTRQMIRLVDDLLDVARITHDKLQLERAPLDLAEVARAALDAAAPAFHSKGLRLVSEGLELPLPMFGDAGRLQQVFANLLSNALRFTPEGRQVKVTCRRRGLACEVGVSDEGRGIESNDLVSIFNMFTQARQGLARSEGGLGLGLTIAERIVAAHGGTLVARSDGLGKGSVFTIRLTLDTDARIVESSPANNNGKLRIVVVEDQEDARETVRLLLELEGHEVAAAKNGKEGLALILEQRPQVCLLDVGLPEMNGLDLAKAVRNQLGASVKLVAMSGYGQPDDVRRAETSGFDRHLTKPLEPRRLIATLSEVMQA